jgi:hypothetical protein
VDEMTHDEANEVLVALKFQGSKKDISDIFNNIGTSPAMLVNLVVNVPNKSSVKKFIDHQISTAESDLLAFPHQLLLEKLKMSPDGVKVKIFKGIIDKGVNLSDPKAVGVAMNSSNAIVYRQEDYSYRRVEHI